jgi:hypothetical protein
MSTEHANRAKCLFGQHYNSAGALIITRVNLKRFYALL